MNAVHPKWCALSGHDGRVHYSVTVTAGAVAVALRQVGDNQVTLLLSVAGTPASTLSMDQAQALSAGLISLLVRTDAA